MLQKVNSKQLQFLKNEFCILVDQCDKSLGYASKEDCHLVSKGLPLHRAFSVFIFHENQILLQQRSENKVTWPLKWANSCCSHPLRINNNEEDVYSAIQRKCVQELGIIPKNLKFKGKILYKALEKDWGEHELDHIYTAHIHQKLIPFDREEVNAIRWCNAVEIQNMDESVLTPWFSLIKKEFDIFNIKEWPSIIPLKS
eukprot:NODE_559_length_6071_cov_0.798895.p5 type:complete len:199 gc:universal NODE_559_length_6071_cov_0.798895:1671-1075(-)